MIPGSLKSRLLTATFVHYQCPTWSPKLWNWVRNDLEIPISRWYQHHVQKYCSKTCFCETFLFANTNTSFFVKKTFLMIPQGTVASKCSIFWKSLERNASILWQNMFFQVIKVVNQGAGKLENARTINKKTKFELFREKVGRFEFLSGENPISKSWKSWNSRISDSQIFKIEHFRAKNSGP